MPTIAATLPGTDTHTAIIAIISPFEGPLFDAFSLLLWLVLAASGLVGVCLFLEFELELEARKLAVLGFDGKLIEGKSDDRAVDVLIVDAPSALNVRL